MSVDFGIWDGLVRFGIWVGQWISIICRELSKPRYGIGCREDIGLNGWRLFVLETWFKQRHFQLSSGIPNQSP
jgi:hypothetical protein